MSFPPNEQMPLGGFPPYEDPVGAPPMGGGMPIMPGLPQQNLLYETDMADQEVEEENRPQAPVFPDKEPIDFDEQTQKELADMISQIYENRVISRDQYLGQHLTFDQMYQGRILDFNPREGPWEDSANLHVQMPYWLVDALQARAVYTIWSQNPLVQAGWTEDDDEEVAKDAARTVEWQLQPNRMRAEAMWRTSSKIRFIHGNSCDLVSYVHDKHRYRVLEGDPEAEPEYATNPDGSYQLDDDTGEPITVAQEPSVTYKETTLYRGPVIQPIEWDDILPPIDCENLQPKRLKNPMGAYDVCVRQWETLLVMNKKFKEGVYPGFEEWAKQNGASGKDLLQPWRDQKGDQTRSGQARAGGTNNERIRQQDDMRGQNRTQAVQTPAAAMTTETNPEYQIITYFGPYLHPDTGEEEEMVMFVCKDPEVFLGAFLLTDICWTGKRPLLEKHFQRVSNQWYSMGVCEIISHLSEELDTIHNMRVDVGIATNLQWYFIKASSSLKPSEVELKPLALIPVEDPQAVWSPQTNNVTSFYHQEETLLLTIIERVMGISDLFLGISPTSGASARHATGFLGTKAEAEARLAPLLQQDAEAFAFMSELVYDLEIQHGPMWRTFRLLGEDSQAAKTNLSRDDLWFRGTYDFRLGANVGMFSQQNRFQRAQTAYQVAANSPLTNQDMGRRWEIESEQYTAMGYSESDVVRFIGPKSAVSQGTPIDFDEENAQMSEYKYGFNKAAPVHPSDNDQEHIQGHQEYQQSEDFNILDRPNQVGHLRHIAMHNEQAAKKMAQQQQQQAQAMMQQAGGGPQSPNAADPANRASAQIGNVQGGGASNFANAYQAQTAGNGAVTPPPNLNGSM